MNLDDRQVELVWNKGIASFCDRRIPDEFPDSTNYVTVETFAGGICSSGLPDNLIADPQQHYGIREGELVWVRLSWLKSFISQVLPHVQSRFVLVTGDSDSCVPSELMDEARTILNHPKIIHWYTQNHDGLFAADRISPIPIGVDFHSNAGQVAWGERPTSPARQEHALKELGDRLPSLADRLPKVYLDFAFQRGLGLRSYRRRHPLKGTNFHETRRKVTNKLRGSHLVVHQKKALPRSEMWRRRGEYAFVLSPHGTGIDCHRTWEALALGHIVLVTMSSITGLFDTLPVIVLKDWSEINAENLEKWFVLHRDGKGSHAAMTSTFWEREMRLKVLQHL